MDEVEENESEGGEYNQEMDNELAAELASPDVDCFFPSSAN